MANNKSSNNNELLVYGAQQAIDQMKYEIASELVQTLVLIQLHAANGSVGGEITKRLVQYGRATTWRWTFLKQLYK